MNPRSTITNRISKTTRHLAAVLIALVVMSFSFVSTPLKAEAATLKSAAAITLAKKKASAERKKIITIAKRYRGVRYTFGGSTPASGFDCSGYTKFTFKHALKMNLPHSANAQSKLGRRVSAAHAKPGDLVLYSYPGDKNFHVAIYLNKKQVIHAKKPGTVTQIGNLHWGGTRVTYVDVVDPHVGL